MNCLMAILVLFKTGSSDSGPENIRITSPEKHLHTVAEKLKEVRDVTDSLLGSIERSSEHVDKLDRGYTTVNFRGTVHRVNSTGVDNRYASSLFSKFRIRGGLAILEHILDILLKGLDLKGHNLVVL